MSNIRERREVLMKRILEGDGKAAPFERRAAFNNSGVYEPLRKLIDKVAMHADTVTDEDITAVKVSGLSEDHIFETVICAAVGQATRQYDRAFAALDNATVRK